MFQKETAQDTAGSVANPRAGWIIWNAEAEPDVVEKVMHFDPLDHAAGHAAATWLKSDARLDVFTVTYLLVSDARVEGFITCRVSEAVLTWSGIEQLGGAIRKTVPAYLLCWCAKHREAEVAGEELLLNAVRLGRELRPYGCAILALDPYDKKSSERVWQAKHGFRQGAAPLDSEQQPRLWLPLDTD